MFFSSVCCSDVFLSIVIFSSAAICTVFSEKVYSIIICLGQIFYSSIYWMLMLSIWYYELSVQLSNDIEFYLGLERTFLKASQFDTGILIAMVLTLS